MSAVKSPCVNICALDDHDICVGCYRSAAEIAAWTGMTEDRRQEVVRRADERYREAWGPQAR
jgi:predicted Fe-S protein YdhL (DUF1289 family)